MSYYECSCRKSSLCVWGAVAVSKKNMSSFHRRIMAGAMRNVVGGASLR